MALSKFWHFKLVLNKVSRNLMKLMAWHLLSWLEKFLKYSAYFPNLSPFQNLGILNLSATHQSSVSTEQLRW